MSLSQHKWLRKENLRDKSEAELREEINKLKKQQFQNRFDRSTGKLENFRELAITRKRLAIINTLLREKELQRSAKEAK